MGTAISTVAGILAGGLITWWFARSGRRDLLKQVANLKEALSDLTNWVSHQAENPARPQEGPQPNEPGAVISPANPALELVLRGKMGTLLNAHGEVATQRLFDEVLKALPGTELGDIESSLVSLRRAGRVVWDGDDVARTGVVRLTSP